MLEALVAVRGLVEEALGSVVAKGATVAVEEMAAVAMATAEAEAVDKGWDT